MAAHTLWVTSTGMRLAVAEYWVFFNKHHKYARMHRSECVFCDEGRGLHHRPNRSAASSWLGPYGSSLEAMRVAEGTGQPASACSACAPS